MEHQEKLRTPSAQSEERDTESTEEERDLRTILLLLCADEVPD